MAMNKQRRTANLNNIVTYDTLKNVTLLADLTVEGLTGAGFVKADANGLLSVDTGAYLPFPSQSGNAGKFLKTDGTNILWDTVPSVNIYNSDGTLTGNRVVTLGGNNLTYANDGLAQYASTPAGLRLVNNTVSTGGINQYSPPIIMSGAGWNYSGSTAVSIRQYLKTITNAPANPIWQLESSINNGAYTSILRAYTNGTISGLIIGSYSEIGDAQISANGKTGLLVAGDIRTYGGYQYNLGLVSTVSGSYLQSYTNNGASPTQSIYFGYFNTIFSSQDITFSGGTTSSKYFGYTTGNWTIGGTSDAGYKLDVKGTVKITGDTLIDNNLSITGAGSTRILSISGYTTYLRLSSSSSIGYFDISKGLGYAQISSINEQIRYSSPTHLFGGTTDVSSAIVNIESTTKGLLPPRMTTTQKTAIATPAAGLIVYDSTVNKSSYYNGTAWVDGGDNIYNSDGTLTGNRNLNLGGYKLNITNGEVRIGTTSTSAINNAGRLLVGDPANNGALSFINNTIYVNGANGYHFQVGTGLNDTTAIQLFQVRNNGNVIIQTGGTFTDAGYKLDVQGTARVSGAIRNTGTNENIIIHILNESQSVGYRSVLVGRTQGTVSGVGVGFSVQSAGGVSIGATVTSGNGVSIGNSSVATGGATVGSGSTSLDGVSVGTAAVSNFQGIAIGNSVNAVATSSSSNAIAIGNFSYSVDSTFVSGSSVRPITNVFFGSGISNLRGDGVQTSGAGTAYTINGSGAFGTDFAGGNITIAGGKGTGAGASGDVIISTATPTSTGTTLQSLTERVWVKGSTGNMGIGGSPNASYKLDVTGAARVSGAMTAGANSVIGGITFVGSDSVDFSSSISLRYGGNTRLNITSTNTAIGGSLGTTITLNTNSIAIGETGGIGGANAKIMLGQYAGYSSSTNGDFVAIGAASFFSTTNPTNGIAIGGRNAGAGASRGNTGNHTTCFFFGSNTGASTNSVSLSNTYIIGNDITTDASNTVILGRSDQNVTIGGVLNAGYKLDVNGTGRFTNTLSVITTGTTNDVALFKSTEPYITIEAVGGSNSASIFLKPSTSAQNATIQNRSGGGIEFYTGATPSISAAIKSTGAVVVSSTLGFNGVEDSVKSGKYTPTLTNGTNVSSSAVNTNTFKYIRVGNTVHVSGWLSLTATSANTLTELEVSLPIASNITSDEDVSGVANTLSGGYGQVRENATNNTAKMYVQPTSTGNLVWYLEFSYSII